MKYISLKSDVRLTIGTGNMPVDLASMETKSRVGLTEDESAVAMLLTDPCPAKVNLLPRTSSCEAIWGTTCLRSRR